VSGGEDRNEDVDTARNNPEDLHRGSQGKTESDEQGEGRDRDGSSRSLQPPFAGWRQEPEGGNLRSRGEKGRRRELNKRSIVSSRMFFQGGHQCAPIVGFQEREGEMVG